jgi:predicted dehydrogenase
VTDREHRTPAVAIAGAGFMGRVHARAALVNGARLVGISSSNPDRAARAAAGLGAPRGYVSSEELVTDPEVDVVHVCTPNHLHAPLVLAALDAGKHVICEKPLATNVTSALELFRRAESAGVVAAVPYVYRYYAMVREARIRIRVGQLGRLALVHGSYLQDWLLDSSETNWRVDPVLGGPSRSFADIGSHWCDLVEFVTGDRIERVNAQFDTVRSRRPDPVGSGDTFSSAAAGTGGGGPAHGSVAGGDGVWVSTEDTAVVQFRTTAGALGSVVVSQVAAGHKNHLSLELFGTEGSASFDDRHPDLIRISRDGATTELERDPQRLSSDAAQYSRMPAGHAQGYQDCVDAFVGETYQAVRTGETDPLLPTFAAGVRAAAITDAVIASAANGSPWVEVVDPLPAVGPRRGAPSLHPSSS